MADHVRFHLDENVDPVVAEDFLIMHSRGMEHPGIVYCHLGERSVGQMIESLRLIYEILTPDEMKGRVEYI